MIIRNFLFHRINPARDKLWDPMSPELFKKVIQYITQKHHVVNIEEFVLNKQFKPKSKKLASVLFDDGYKDNIEYAVPILKKYDCPASFYVVTDCIDKNIPTWTHILEHLFQNTNKLNFKIDFSLLPKQFTSDKWKSNKERILYAKQLKPYLKTIGHNKREQILNQIIEHFNDVQLPKIMMSWNDIKQLKSEGYTIGSHSVTHSMLGTMTNDDDVFNELFFSGERIKEQTKIFPLTISYPLGSYNHKTITLSKKAGYKMGLAVKQEFYNTEKDNIFKIPRTELYNEKWLKTKMRITGNLERLKRMIKYR